MRIILSGPSAVQRFVTALDGWRRESKGLHKQLTASIHQLNNCLLSSSNTKCCEEELPPQNDISLSDGYNICTGNKDLLVF